jgi:hypothetical protein
MKIAIKTTGKKKIFNRNSLFQREQVSKYWNILALDGSNWQKIDLFYFQMDIEVRARPARRKLVHQ